MEGAERARRDGETYKYWGEGIAQPRSLLQQQMEREATADSCGVREGERQHCTEVIT